MVEKPETKRRVRGSSDESVSSIDREIRNHIRSAIRTVWSRYDETRKTALHNAKRYKSARNKDGTLSKRPNVVYICALCQKETKATEVQVDHILPIGKTPAFPPKPDDPDWTNWILRVFCNLDNLQVTCLVCHKQKTAEERGVQSALRRNKQSTKTGTARRSRLD